MTRVALLAALLATTATAMPAEPPPPTSCFLLRGPRVPVQPADAACRDRVSPLSTFKIPHALAALDAGVSSGPDALLEWDGTATSVEAWRRDHTFASAMHSSVVWYFQRLATTLGMEREREYLERFDYGNKDASSGLTTFWLGGSLKISAEEQLAFLERLYADKLPVKAEARRAVLGMLVQPAGTVVNSLGKHPFAAPWPADTVVSAKTGGGHDADGRQVRWLVGHVTRGADSWLFVSLVTGGDDVAPGAAIEQAARALREAKVL